MALGTRYYLDNNTLNPTSGGFIFWDEKIKDGRSPKITLEMDRSSATRIVGVAWDSWQPFATAVLGYTMLGNRGTVGTSSDRPALLRSPPWAIPLNNISQNTRFLFADKIDIEGIGTPTDNVCFEGVANNAIARYQQARCTVHFSTRTYEILSDLQMNNTTVNGTSTIDSTTNLLLPLPGNDEANLKRYITKIVKPGGEFLTIDASAYYYQKVRGSDNNAIALARGINKTIGSCNVALTWHLIPREAVPSKFYNPGCANQAIDKCLGRVNRADFDGQKPGTMLLMAVDLKPLVSPIGDRVFDITYMFKWFNPSSEEFEGSVPGHNHVYRAKASNPDDIGWYEVLADRVLAIASPYSNFTRRKDGINIHDFADFNNLFRPANYPPPSVDLP